MSTERLSNDRRFWIMQGEHPDGPFDVKKIHEMLVRGEINWQTPACLFGGGQWLPLFRTPGFGPITPIAPHSSISRAIPPQSSAQQASSIANESTAVIDVPLSHVIEPHDHQKSNQKTNVSAVGPSNKSAIIQNGSILKRTFASKKTMVVLGIICCLTAFTALVLKVLNGPPNGQLPPPVFGKNQGGPPVRSSTPDAELFAHNKKANDYLSLGYYDKTVRETTFVIDRYKKLILDPLDSMSLPENLVEVAYSYCLRGSAYAGKKDASRALLDFSDALVLDKKFKDCYFRRGQLYFATGKMDLALKDLNEAIDLDCKNADYYTVRAGVFCSMGNFEDALADCNASIRIKHGTSVIYVMRGTVFHALGHLDDALKDFNEAIRLDHSNGVAFFGRSDVNFDLGKLEESDSDLEQATILNSDFEGLGRDGVPKAPPGFFDKKGKKNPPGKLIAPKTDAPKGEKSVVAPKVETPIEISADLKQAIDKNDQKTKILEYLTNPRVPRYMRVQYLETVRETLLPSESSERPVPSRDR